VIDYALAWHSPGVTLSFCQFRALAPLTLALALAACDNDDTKPLTPDLADGKIIGTTQVVIQPNKRGCVSDDEVYATCLDIGPTTDEYGYAIGSVWGFEFEWGHRYTLEVNVVEMPAEWGYGDGEILNYELVAVVEDQLAIAEEFDLPAYAFRIDAGASAGTLVDQTPVSCAPELCDAIAAIPPDPISPMVRVRFGDQQPLPLVAVELLEGG
jgi:hypothetical protein